MISARFKAGIALGLMALAFGGATAWRPTVKLADTQAKIELESLFPTQFGPWRMDDRVPVQLVSPDTQALLNKIYNQTLSRTYVNADGTRVMLSVAYGGDQSDATRAHRPEVCYPAQGFQLLSNVDSVTDLEGQALRVRRLVAKQGGRNEPITYWIMVGDQAAVSNTEQKLAQLRYSTRGLVPDGMLVRVSTIDAEPARAFAAHDVFLRNLRAALPASAQQTVFGRTGGRSPA